MYIGPQEPKSIQRSFAEQQLFALVFDDEESSLGEDEFSQLKKKQTKCYHSAHVFHCINVQREQIGTCTCWLHIIKSVSKASQWLNSLTLFPNLMDPCPIVHAHCNMEGSQGNEGRFYCHIQLQGWFLGQEGGWGL